MPDLIGHLPFNTRRRFPVGAGNDKKGECCDKTLEFWHS